MLLLLLTGMILLSACGKQDKAQESAVDLARKAVEAGKEPDFDALKKEDETVIAWLYIPGTKVNDPVSTDSNAGIFLQTEINSADFSDRGTVLYGKLSSDGSQFGELQKIYSEDGSLQKYREITVFTPEKTLHYEAFCAASFSDRHVLTNYYLWRFLNSFEDFLHDVLNYHSMSRQYDETVTVGEADRLLVLSCHARQSDDQRYLILARSVDEAG